MKFLLSILTAITVFTAKAQTPLEKTLLWQITGPGISKPSYVYGTIHLICPQDIIVSTELRARFYSTKQLYLELDMDDPGITNDSTYLHAVTHGNAAVPDAV